MTVRFVPWQTGAGAGQHYPALKPRCYLWLLSWKSTLLCDETPVSDKGDLANAQGPFSFATIVQRRADGWLRYSPARANAAGDHMNGAEQKYSDRFGNDWSVIVESTRGKPRCVSFTCGEFRLIVEDKEGEDQTALTSTQLKDLFCAAERVLLHGKETWYVGYRSRTGRGGRPVGGVQTRFRSDRGEIRYARCMVNFRHMGTTALLHHLDIAKASTRSPSEGAG